MNMHIQLTLGITYSWDNLRLSFLAPVGDFLVDLLSEFWFDFSGVSCEQGKESLRPTIDDIDFME